MNSKREKRIRRQEEQRDRQRQRQAQNVVEPAAKKTVPQVEIPANANDGPVIWDFTRFDDYDWRTSKAAEHASFVDVANRLRDYARRTWNEILRDVKRDHACEIGSLSAAAQKRLIELDLEHIGELLRFRFSGTQRLWGIRDRSFFIVVWWDPDHQVYPVSLQ